MATRKTSRKRSVRKPAGKPKARTARGARKLPLAKKSTAKKATAKKAAAKKAARPAARPRAASSKASVAIVARTGVDPALPSNPLRDALARRRQQLLSP